MNVDKTPKQPGEGPIAGRLYPKVTKYFSNVPPGRLLDVGTGKGNLANRLHNMGFDVYACDVQKENQHKSLKWRQVDLNKGVLPYDDAFFDYVTFTEVMEHLENPRTILREISRVLKKDGFAIVTSPHLLSLPQRIYFLFTGNFLHFEFPSQKYGHITPMSINMIKDAIEKQGMKIEAITYDRGWIPLLRLSLPANFWFGDLCIIKIRKS